MTKNWLGYLILLLKMVKLNRLQAFIREYTENYNIKFNTENREVLGVDLSVSFLMLFFHQKRHWKHYWRFYCIVLNLPVFNPGQLNVEFFSTLPDECLDWSMSNQSILKNGLEYQKCLKIENCSNNRIRNSRVIAPNKSYYTFMNCIFSSNWF